MTLVAATETDPRRPAESETLTGRFGGPVVGLRYETPTCSGVTDESGTFRYRRGEVVAFFVGGVLLGAAQGAGRLTLAHIVARVDGNIAKVADPGLTNIARLLLTLGGDGDGIVLTPEVARIVGDRPIDFRYRIMTLGPAGPDPAQAFADDPVVTGLLDDLRAAGMDRALATPAAAHNEVRRMLMGIRRFRDLRIPLRNGSFVLADVFRPDTDEPVPTVMNCGVYGRAFVHHSICDADDAEHHEVMEDRYFSGNPDGYEFENHESVNVASWVPQGYAVVRVDGPGAGKSPGTLGVWGIDEAEAYHDAIEWAGTQPWSNGNVGLWGMSYYAMNQHAVASLHPSHLKAMIAIGTDTDLYEEVAYTGGILNEQFFPIWYRSGVLPAICGEVDAKDFLAIMRANPFRDSDPDAIFGPRAGVLMSPDLTDVDVPLWAVAVTTHPSSFHQLGSSETYLNTPTPHKKLDFWEDWFLRAYSEQAVEDHRAFFDHWLRGIDNGVMDRAPIRLEVRTGRGASFVQEEHEWPIERTEYVRWYLDASAGRTTSGGDADAVLALTAAAPSVEQSASYSAEPDPDAVVPRAHDALSAPSRPGVSFVSEPLPKDVLFAGYSKLVLWVSSSTDDMDVFASIRVLDETGREVDWAGPALIPGIPNNDFYPLARGWLKVSHRKLDAQRSTDFRPKHTHLKADHAPLAEGEVVPVEIEIIPNTALLRAGWRIRLDVQAVSGAGHGNRHFVDPSYHTGAVNTIHTGPEHESWLQLPFVPPRQA